MRVAAAVLIAAVPPILVKSAANPEGLPIEVFDGLRSSLAKDRPQFYKDFALMFYGANRPGARVSQGMLDQFWRPRLILLTAGHPCKSSVKGKNTSPKRARESAHFN